MLYNKYQESRHFGSRKYDLYVFPHNSLLHVCKLCELGESVEAAES